MPLLCLGGQSWHYWPTFWFSVGGFVFGFCYYHLGRGTLPESIVLHWLLVVVLVLFVVCGRSSVIPWVHLRTLRISISTLAT